MLSEISQKKDKYWYVFNYMWNIENKLNEYNKKKYMQRTNQW